jgi:hypothetical protein
MRAGPAAGELFGPLPRYLPESLVARSGARQGESADKKDAITVEVIRFAAEAINEIQPTMDRRFALSDLVCCRGHYTSKPPQVVSVPGRIGNTPKHVRHILFEVIDTPKEKLYTLLEVQGWSSSPL